MPQMAPISWIILFFVFSMAFIIFNILNFFCFNNSPMNQKAEKIVKNFNNSLNWKW